MRPNGPAAKSPPHMEATLEACDCPPRAEELLNVQTSLCGGARLVSLGAWMLLESLVFV